MKRVLFVIDTLRMGGAEKSLISLLKSLDPKKVSVDLFLFEHDGVLQPQVPEWVNILKPNDVTKGMTLELRKYLPLLLKRGHFLSACARIRLTLMSKLKKKDYFGWKYIAPYIPSLSESYDVAVGYLEGFPDFYVLDKVNAKEKIGWIHIDYSGRSLPAEAIAYYSRFDRIATISEICKDAFVKLVPQARDRIHVIENIVLPEEVFEKSQESVSDAWEENGIPHLVSVGRLDYQKGMDIGARAAKVLKDRGVNFCWHVYGKGVMHDEIDEYVKSNNLQESFILEGIRTNPYPYIKKAHLIVQPSRFEGKSIVLDEAKILGKAIVVTNYPSVYDQIQHGVTGYLTEIDPSSIADGIIALLDNRELKVTLEKNAEAENNNSIQATEKLYSLLEV